MCTLRNCLAVVLIAFFLTSPQIGQQSFPTKDSIHPTIIGSIGLSPTGQDDVAQLLGKWAKSGEADAATVNRLLANVDITSKAGEDAFLSLINAAGKDAKGGAGAFTQKVLDTLDRRRFAKVDAAIQEVMDLYGKELEAVIRTGSSGQRHLQLRLGQESTGYRIFFSDDDVSFVGQRAVEASRMLNEILEREGLAKLKVKGFDLLALKNVRGIDLTALNMLDPEKFLGEAGMAGIKGEMLTKGAVVAQRSGETLSMTAQPLRSFVESKKSQMLAELLDDDAVRAAVNQFGSLTVVGSCERQIVSAHGGWDRLADPEKVKYVLRQRLALTESGAMRDLAGEGLSASQATLAKLRQLKGKPNLTADEMQWLSNLRTQNLDLAFKEIPHKLGPIIEAAENTGRSLASNPQARKMMDELTTGFALMRDRMIDIPEEQVLAKLRSMAGESKEVYDMLYTSFQQSKDLVQALDQWVASGGTREAFLDMLLKAENRLARLQQIAARKARNLKAPEARTLTAIEEMLGTDLGDTFVVKMLRHPAAKKVVLSALVAVGGSVAIKAMYNSWMSGKFQDDLSGAAFGLMEFVPGGIGVKRALIEGMDTTTTLLFIKDALYLTPAWPIVLSGDVLYIAVDLGTMYKIQMQQAGLVDVLVYNGEYDLTGDRAKFVKLALPDGSAWAPDGIDEWLFQTRAVRVKRTLEGGEYRIDDLQAVSTQVLDQIFIPEDPVTEQLRLAAEQQLDAINSAESWNALEAGHPFAATVGFGKWLAGFETVCSKSPDRWCKVFELLKRKISERREFVKEKVMVPQLIEMAELKRSQLDAAVSTEAKLDKLQDQFEQARGSKLEVRLSEKVKAQADALASAVPTDTTEERTLKRGSHWLAAYTRYSNIWKWGKDIPRNIAGRTGCDPPKIFQFKWTGDAEDDERKADQSRAGFASELAKINRDIRAIKGRAPVPTDLVDKEAFAILCSVVFPWRAALDESDTGSPESGSAYFDEYEAALVRVKALYAGNAEFEELLAKGAVIIKGQETLTLDRGTSLELKLNDSSLAKMYAAGELNIAWISTSNGDFSPGSTGLKTNFAPFSPEPATIRVSVERRGAKARGMLEVRMPVTVPDNFLTLSIAPGQPKAGEFAKVEASVPERFFGGRPRFVYKWLCENCKADDFDRSSTTVTAPKSGSATVTCDLGVEGSNGKVSPLTRATIRFAVTSESPTPTPSQTPSPTPSVTPSPSPTATPGDEIDISKVEFGGNVPGIWDGGKNPKGFSFKRQPAKAKAAGECQWEGYVNSEVWGRIGDWRAPRAEEMGERIASITASNKAWGKTTTVRDISISGFKGKLVESSIAWYYGSWSDAGFRGESISAGGTGWLYKGPHVVEVGYSVSGGGCWTNTLRPFLMSQGSAAQGDARAIIDGLTLVEKNDFKKVPYTGPKLDGSDMPKVMLVPSAIEKLKVGDTVKVNVVVENAKPEDSPFKYDWGGEFVGKGTPAAKTAAYVTIKAEKPGKFPLSVSVEGAQYFLGSASLEYQVADYKVQLERTGKITSKVPVGGTADLKATLTVDGKPASGNFTYRWQPITEVTFTGEEGPDATNTAKFQRPGRAKIWVEVLADEGGRLATVAESNQVEIDVVLPKLTLTLTPAKGVIGSEVKAKVTTDVPDLKEIDYRWEVSSNGKLLGESQDSSEITFAPQDPKPITITVNARVPGTGDDLGKQTATFTADKADVKVTVLGPEGPRPQVWREGVGLVTLEKEIAVHQFVNMRADVSPQIEGMRFEWSVNEDSHFAGNNITQAIRAYRSQPGSCEVIVVVRNKDGLELGRGSGSFSVTVSQADLNNARDMGGTTQKLANAKTLVAKGQLDEAISLVDEVAKATPKNTEAVNLAAQWKRDRTTIQTQLAKVRTLIDQQKFVDASKELTVAKNLHNLYPPVVAIEKELNEKTTAFESGVNNAVLAIKDAIDKRNYKRALDLCTEIRSKFKILPQTEQTVRDYEVFARTHEAEKERIRGVLKQGEAKYNNGDFEGALADFAQLWVNFNAYWNADVDPEPRYYENLRNQALAKRDRIASLVPQIKQAADNPVFDKAQLESALAKAGEVLAIQPANSIVLGYKTTISAKLARGPGGAKAEEAIKRGDQLANEKKWGDAVKAYDEAIKADPTNANAYRVRGRAKRENGDFNGSLKDFNKALELDPSNHQSWVGRGLVKVKLGDKAGAMSDYDRAIGLNPNYAGGYSSRASLKIDLADFAGAIADYDRAISIDPKVSAYYANRAYAKAKLADHRGAIEDYTRAVDLDPNNAIAFNNRGHAKQQLGDLRGALADYEKALAVNPDYKTAQNNLAKIKELIAGQSPTPVPTPTGSKYYPVDLAPVGGKKGTVHKAKEVEIDNASWIRLKSTDEKRLNLTIPVDRITANAVAVVSNLDDSHYLAQGKTVAKMTVITTAGRHVFEIKAGIHSADWGGPESAHQRDIPAAISKNPFEFMAVFQLPQTETVTGLVFDYVETNAQRWVGHAPGFVLKGVTLIGADTRPTQTDGVMPVVTPTPAPPVSGEAVIYNNTNIAGVYNQPAAATQFTLDRSYYITSIMTYHWNNARGTTRPGTISIRSSDGRTYGPWNAIGSPGQGGVVNAYWTVYPNVTIPAGTYTVLDSDPASWAQNTGSRGMGHTIVKGRASGATAVATPTPVVTSTPKPTPVPTPIRTGIGRYVTAIFENRSNEPAHIFAEGDTFGPGNKIAPGEKPQVRVQMTPTGRIKFIAGRNGQVIATKYWDGDPDDLTRFPRVIFDGRTLVIMTGLR